MMDAAHPTGFTPQQEANMTTAAEEGAGGGQAAAVGEGALLGARTKNAGAPAAAVAEASRGAQRELGSNTLGIKLASADLAQRKRSQALSELGGLYGTSAGASNNALGQVASNSEADSKAKEQSWDWAKYILDPALSAAGNAVKIPVGGCWIAEAIYGVDDPRTHLVRAYLNGPFRDSLTGNTIMAAYLAIGRQVAWLARRSSTLRSSLKPLFDRALNSATIWATEF